MQLKGSILRARALFVAARGPEVERRIIERLSPATRAQWEQGFSPSEWYPRALSDELSRAVMDELGIGDLALHQMGRFAADENLRGIYRIFLKIGFIGLMLKRTAQAYKVHYDAGELRLVESKGHSAILSLSNVPEPSAMHCLPMVGWMRRAGELAGGRDVRCTVTECRRRGSATCEFSLKWL